MQDNFYAADMTARGFCDDWFGCETFRPSAATLKVWSIAGMAWLCVVVVGLVLDTTGSSL